MARRVGHTLLGIEQPLAIQERRRVVKQREVTYAEWEAYLEEALPAEEMAELEGLLRQDPQARGQLAEILSLRDAGLHSLGSLWRQHRLTCPTREDLGSYLLGVLDEAFTSYIEFHLWVVGCRLCQAEWEDLQEQQHKRPEELGTRREKYVRLSARFRSGSPAPSSPLEEEGSHE